MQDSYSEVFSKIDRVMVVLAHPDDMEITCGGLLARLTNDSKKVRLVVTTNGGKGTKDKHISEAEFASTRVAEQVTAGNILGIPQSENFNLQIPDGEVENSVDYIEKITFHVREFKPDLIITHNPETIFIDFFSKSTWVNHRDHVNTGLIAVNAAYPYSRNTNFFPNQLNNDISCHTVSELLITDSYTHKDAKYFDITKFSDKKIQAINTHASALGENAGEDYLSENKFEDKYFEVFRHLKIY